MCTWSCYYLLCFSSTLCFRPFSKHDILMSALARFKKPLKICSSRDVRFLSFYGDVMYQLNRSFNSPSPFHRGHTLGIWHLCCTGEEGIWLSESSRGWGIWTIASILCEISGRFAQAIMADAVLEDFCAKDCAFGVIWLQGKSLNKLFALFKGI